MFDYIFDNAQKGVEKIRANRQLFYTVIVALLIVGSYVFMADRFINIANDAGDRLINVRIGSIQDSFVSFAGDKISDPQYLNDKINDIIKNNETIKKFNVVQKITNYNETTKSTTTQYQIIASNDVDEIGKNDPQFTFIYSLASGDPSHSLTIQLGDAGERFFQTARAIKVNNEVVAVTITTQTLSQADKVISVNIRNSIILLVFIVLLILFLFLRLSKIIDYMELYTKLKEVDQLKDDFISMASHELRTPLSIIRGYAEYIREANELKDETKEFALKIDTSAKDLDGLVGEILDVSRIQQGRMAYSLEKVNPSEIIYELTQSFTIPAKEKGLYITYEKNPKTIQINVDKNKFKQIMVNFIGNAVKYTQKGEVKIKEYVENERLYIRISDTGIGMSAEEREKLFEKFYRIKNKDTAEIRGTGLGLWITAQMTKEMKGLIAVESIKGVGSHFIVSFPLVD